MKNISLILLVIIIFGCNQSKPNLLKNNEYKDSLSVDNVLPIGSIQLTKYSFPEKWENLSQIDDTKEIKINKNWQGDAIISDLDFVNSINSSCKLTSPFFERSEKKVKEDDLKCALSKIKFDYYKLESVKTKISIGRTNPNTELYIKNSISKNTGNADLYSQVSLYVEKNKSLTDSIIIYQSFNYSEALTVKTRNYYIEKEKIYLLDIAEDESGASVEKWEEYKIGVNGKIVLLKQKTFPIETTNSKTTKIDNNSWKGTYHFEASNRDKEITIFNIVINSLDDISININDESSQNKYSHIKAQEIDTDKIKIIYNNSSDEMGTIFIEKNDNQFTISGNPIYFINPGNNEMPLKKIK